LKYPVDACINKKANLWLYGGDVSNDNIAAKSSNHDLIGLSYCSLNDENCKLNFPLTALIDYQGFRLSVMTTLPISKKH